MGIAKNMGTMLKVAYMPSFSQDFKQKLVEKVIPSMSSPDMQGRGQYGIDEIYDSMARDDMREDDYYLLEALADIDVNYIEL